MGLLAEIGLRHRSFTKFLLHVAIFVFANHFAYFIRFDFQIPRQYFPVIRETIPVLLITKALGFLAFGQFRGWWRYVSIRDVLPAAGACMFGTVLFAALGNTFFLVMAARFFIRAGREIFGRKRRESDRNVLIVGAGLGGQMIAREMRENPSLGMVEMGFIDDDKAKIGTKIQGLRVLGDHEEIADICRKHDVDEIIIAIPSAPPSVIRHIVEHCRDLPAKFRILPGVGELIDGKVSLNALRNVDLEDLLGRDQVALDADLLHRDITERIVMVTGAAGSIGSELCRQVARLSPARLVMFDIAESALFDMEHEMGDKFPHVPIVPVIGDVRDKRRVREIVSMHQPAVIYHAAAYKHVPVMEVHPVEAVKNNVLGTLVVAEAAAECGVERFVLVSTDKAVRPTNVMGASKRVAELIVQSLNASGKETTFVAVRFGNVLDSVGSVIPIFRRQLETTGKLTITDPEASRYFMLIPEAAGLILQAGSMGRGGEVFVLEMGEPVKIVDLARNMIRLSGKELGVDAEIEFTGLRPGEKLHEELVVEGEDVVRTTHPKVMMMIRDTQMPEDWAHQLKRLIDLAVHGDRVGVIRQLKVLVKGYAPRYEFHGMEFPAEDHPSPILPAPPPSKSLH
ncbi:MAG: nucleoside-diphosphate sugar epimerase [Actinobacteria bacterium]|nr:nucleoside-diphosphate sugar epimerase [Actinomycetota bacterium]